MKYYMISFVGQRTQNWVLHVNDHEKGLLGRDEYLDLRCPACRKFDELAALKRGVSKDFKVKSRFNLLRTNDGFFCFDAKLKVLLADSGVTGLEYFSIPSSPDYFIAWPTHLVAVDLKGADVVFEPPCEACGRPLAQRGYVTLDYLEIPSDPLIVFHPNYQPEIRSGRTFDLILSEVVVNIMKKAKISGFSAHLLQPKINSKK